MKDRLAQAPPHWGIEPALFALQINSVHSGIVPSDQRVKHPHPKSKLNLVKLHFLIVDGKKETG